MMYRIAWCIKTVGSAAKYSYGGWQEEKNYIELKDWCYTQNALDFNAYYWLEKKEGEEIKNVVDKKEEFETEFVSIEKH